MATAAPSPAAQTGMDFFCLFPPPSCTSSFCRCFSFLSELLESFCWLSGVSISATQHDLGTSLLLHLCSLLGSIALHNFWTSNQSLCFLFFSGIFLAVGYMFSSWLCVFTLIWSVGGCGEGETECPSCSVTLLGLSVLFSWWCLQQSKCLVAGPMWHSWSKAVPRRCVLPTITYKTGMFLWIAHLHLRTPGLILDTNSSITLHCRWKHLC